MKLSRAAAALLAAAMLVPTTLHAAEPRSARTVIRGGLSLNDVAVLGEDGVYVKSGYAAEALALDRAQAEYAARKLAAAVQDWLYGSRLFFAVVPDKGYYLSDGLLPHIEPGDAAAILAEHLPGAEEIELAGLLSLESYYRTDTHWDQRALLPAAQAIFDAMGLGVTLGPADSFTVSAYAPYEGLFIRRHGLPLVPDTIYMLHSAVTDAAYMTGPALDGRLPLYTEDKLHSSDAYSVFAGGVQSVITVESPLAATDRELIVFRDSFSAALVPLLALGYSKITLIDLRFVPEKLLGKYIDFRGQDVLFLYSTLMLNSGTQLK